RPAGRFIRAADIVVQAFNVLHGHHQTDPTATSALATISHHSQAQKGRALFQRFAYAAPHTDF
ncbi:MAG: hypothetical protein QGF29_10000, partial [Verrucomicrobiota bacterium]|nr:hypothetical protein [Verrucomicrobiota bacterium]